MMSFDFDLELTVLITPCDYIFPSALQSVLVSLENELIQSTGDLSLGAVLQQLRVQTKPSSTY